MSHAAKIERMKGGAGAGDPEVDELLRAAEDELLLGISVNAHTTDSLFSSLDPDLARRFEALKRPPPPPPPPQLPDRQSASTSGGGGLQDEDLGMVIGDDLAARFAALKATSSGSSIPSLGAGHVGDDYNRHRISEKEEDEVERVLQWAIDAARLDPSSTIDDEDEGGDDDGGVFSEDEEEDEDDEIESMKNPPAKTVSKPKKRWFF